MTTEIARGEPAGVVAALGEHTGPDPSSEERTLDRDLHLVGLAARRPLQTTDPLLGLPQLGITSFDATVARRRERRRAALQQPIPPLVVERLGDLLLQADVTHAAIAAQASQRDLGLLLRRERPVVLFSPIPLIEDQNDHHPKTHGPGNRQRTTRVCVRGSQPFSRRQGGQNSSATDNGETPEHTRHDPDPTVATGRSEDRDEAPRSASGSQPHPGQ